MKPYWTDIPSGRRALLASLIGQRLCKLVRHSWLPGDEVISESGLESHRVFGWTEGPLTLEFESGLVVGAADEPSANSIILWVECDRLDSTAAQSSLAGDGELVPISSNDARYADAAWAAIHGARVRAITVWRRQGQSVLHDDLPSEAAVEFEFDNDARFFLSHGLHDGSDGFAVLLPYEVPSHVTANLHLVFRLGGAIRSETRGRRL